MQIQINNTSDLMNVIKSDELSVVQAEEIVTKALNVFSVRDYTKEELIEETEHFIDEFCQDGSKDRPIFL